VCAPRGDIRNGLATDRRQKLPGVDIGDPRRNQPISYGKIVRMSRPWVGRASGHVWTILASASEKSDNNLLTVDYFAQRFGGQDAKMSASRARFSKTPPRR
jgi:hypothetical protein